MLSNSKPNKSIYVSSSTNTLLSRSNTPSSISTNGTNGTNGSDTSNEKIKISELSQLMTTAATNNNVDTIKKLLIPSSSFSENDIKCALRSYHSTNKGTPLYIASKLGNVDIVRLLVSHKYITYFIDIQMKKNLCMFFSIIAII
jgi:hypothetical protein